MAHVQPDGYFALAPTGKTSAGAVLVLHSWWGLNATVKSFCDRLAAEGCTVFAPDLFEGKIATTVAQVEALSRAADPNQVKRDIQRSAEFLLQRAASKTSTLAVVGFSYGAYFALDLSVTHPELVDSVIVFYGTRPSRAEDYSRSTANYLGHFAEKDPFEPSEFVDQLEAAIRAAGRPVTFHRYPGTGHWFFEPDRPEHNQAAAKLAWERTIAFLTPSVNVS
jgi:carboxymethylenebutenolidase